LGTAGGDLEGPLCATMSLVVVDGPAPVLQGPALIMANTAKWNIRLRHEWLQTPLKKKRMKRSQKIRVGLLDAENRKLKPVAAAPAEPQA